MRNNFLLKMRMEAKNKELLTNSKNLNKNKTLKKEKRKPLTKSSKLKLI